MACDDIKGQMLAGFCCWIPVFLLCVLKAHLVLNLEPTLLSWMKAVGLCVLRVRDSFARPSQSSQTGTGCPAMVSFLLSSRECQMKHGLLPRLWDHAHPGLGAKGRSAKFSKAQLLPAPQPGSLLASSLERGHQPSDNSWHGSEQAVLRLALPSPARKGWFAASGKNIYWFGCGLPEQLSRLLVPQLQVPRPPPSAPAQRHSGKGTRSPPLYTCLLLTFLYSLDSKMFGLNGKKACAHCLKFLFQQALCLTDWVRTLEWSFSA